MNTGGLVDEDPTTKERMTPSAFSSLHVYEEVLYNTRHDMLHNDQMARKERVLMPT